MMRSAREINKESLDHVKASDLCHECNAKLTADELQDGTCQQHHLRIPVGLGILPEQCYVQLEQFKATGRCMSCRRLAGTELMTCGQCQEHPYCSVKCLQVDKDRSTPVCVFIGLRKGLVVAHQDDDAKYILDIESRAKILDSYGDIQSRFKFSWCNIFASQALTERPTSFTYVQLPDKSEDIEFEASSYHKENWGLAQTECQEVLNIDEAHNVGIMHTPELEIRNDEGNLKRMLGMPHMKNEDNIDAKIAEEQIKVEGSIVGRIEEDVRNKMVQRSWESFIAGGSFGGLVRCGPEVVSGLRFGEGWWKGAVFHNSVEVGEASKQMDTEVLVPTPRPRYADFYGDMDSGDESDGGGSSEASCDRQQDSSSLSVSTSSSACSSVQDVSNCDIEKKTAVTASSAKQDKPLKSKPQAPKEISLQFDECLFCSTISSSIKLCARCGVAKYCSKECQRVDYGVHKQTCRRLAYLQKIKSKMPALVKSTLLANNDSTEIVYSLSDLPSIYDHFFGRASCHFLAEIVKVYYQLGLNWITIKDAEGLQAVVPVFPNFTSCSRFHTPFFGDLISLTDCIAPGNFLLMIGVWWNDHLSYIGDPKANDVDNWFYFLTKHL